MATRTRARAPLALLTLVLALASAAVGIAPAVAAGTATTLTGTISPLAVAYGGSATMSGTLRNGVTNATLPGQTVTLESRPAGAASFSTVGTTTTNGSGGYTFTESNQIINTTFRSRFSAVAPYAGSISPLRKLAVAPPLTNLVMTPSGSTAAVNSYRDWSGTTDPSLSGYGVDVQRNVSGHWTTQTSSTINPDGTFTVNFGLNDLGAQSYRINIPATTMFGIKTSPAVKITVGNLVISTGNLVAARQYKAYSVQLLAGYGQAPLTWTVDETLPAGMAFSDSGVLSGTPTKVASTPLTFHVSDSLGQYATKQLTFNVLEPISPTFLDTRLPDGEVGVGYAYKLRVVGGTAPVAVTLTAGTPPAGLAFDAAHRTLKGTPTVAGAVDLTFQAADSASHVVTKTLHLVVAAAGDWEQGRHDAGRTGWNPAEKAIGADNVAGLGVEWSMPFADAVVTRGGVMFSNGLLPGSTATYGVTARNVASGDVLWTTEASANCSRLSLAPTSVICDTGNEIAAYSLSGSHGLIWTTTTTDTGSSFADSLVAGSYVIATKTDTYGVAAYLLTTGQRKWFKTMPGQPVGLASGGGKVVVIDDARNLKTFALTDTGTAGWYINASNIYAIVANADTLFTTEQNPSTGVQSVVWRSLSIGAIQHTYLPPRSVYREIAVDDHNLYLPTASFDEYGTPYNMGVTAVGLTTATEAWHVDTDEPPRAGLSVGGNVLWFHASDRMSYRQPSTLLAISTTDGATLGRWTVDDTSAYPPIPTEGRVILTSGYKTQVWGLAPQVPRITSAILPVGWTGAAYSWDLAAADGSGGYTWSVTAGSLPAGLSLSPLGAIIGTPTTAGLASFTVQVTDSAGSVKSRALTIATRTVASAAWLTTGGVYAHSGLVVGEKGLDKDTVTTFGNQVTTSPLLGGTAYPGGDGEELVVSGSRIFGLNSNGELTAFNSASGLNKTPLWTRAAPTSGERFVGSPSLSGSPTGGTLYAWTTDGLMVALDVVTGAVSWSTPITTVDYTYPGYSNSGVSPLVVGSQVILQTGSLVTAFNTATHAVAWQHSLPANDSYVDVSVSASASSVYALDGCDVVALGLADGHEVWRSRVPKTVQSCSGWNIYVRGDIAPVLSGGVVYMNMSYYGLAAFNASTGAVNWRRAPNANITTLTVTEQWAIVASYGDGGGISVLDKETGDVAGQLSSSVVPVYSGITVAGDLMLFLTQTGRVAAVDLPTMELAWTSSAVSPAPIFSRPVVTGGRIFTYAEDYTGPSFRIVGLGP